jgi:hypothetical protein
LHKTKLDDVLSKEDEIADIVKSQLAQMMWQGLSSTSR